MTQQLYERTRCWNPNRPCEGAHDAVAHAWLHVFGECATCKTQPDQASLSILCRFADPSVKVVSNGASLRPEKDWLDGLLSRKRHVRRANRLPADARRLGPCTVLEWPSGVGKFPRAPQVIGSLASAQQSTPRPGLGKDNGVAVGPSHAAVQDPSADSNPLAELSYARDSKILLPFQLILPKTRRH